MSSKKINYIKDLIKDLPRAEKDQLMLDFDAYITALLERETTKIELMSIAEIADEIEEHHKTYGLMQGLSSGWGSLDGLTKGFVGGEMTVIGGQTSHGKTTTATNIAYNVFKNGHNVLFVTMEMTHKELGSRFRHMHGGSVVDLPGILFQRNDELNWKDIDKLIGEAVKNNVELVVIDHLHYFTRELENVAEDIGRITKEMKKNAIRHNIPILLISHVRKKQYGQKKVGTDDLRGSSYIGQDADVVLMVHRVEDDSATLGKLDQIMIEITKNRNRGFNPNKASAVFEFDGTTMKEPFYGI